jgi:hypothetical protein
MFDSNFDSIKAAAESNENVILCRVSEGSYNTVFYDELTFVKSKGDKLVFKMEDGKKVEVKRGYLDNAELPRKYDPFAYFVAVDNGLTSRNDFIRGI